MELASLGSYADARCNDGSNAGYYFLPAPSNSSRDWVVMLDSGGWCWDEISCQARCATDASRCSSLLWPDLYSPGGILASTEPRLANAHKVYVPYCTSDAHMGNARAYGMQFRGAVVVRSVLADLVSRRGLGGRGLAAPPDRLLFGGVSAGARGAMVHLDYVRGMLPLAEVARQHLEVCAPSRPVPAPAPASAPALNPDLDLCPAANLSLSLSLSLSSTLTSSSHTVSAVCSGAVPV